MLGKPKHGGKDKENLTHFFGHYQSDQSEESDQSEKSSSHAMF